jgi:hypothetical protein
MSESHLASRHNGTSIDRRDSHSCIINDPINDGFGDFGFDRHVVRGDGSNFPGELFLAR